MVRVKSTDGYFINEAMAMQVVNTYRAKCASIVEHWRDADRQIIPMMAKGVETYWGPLKIGLQEILLPNGNRLNYSNLRHEALPGDARYGWVYNRGPRIHKLYGAKVVENECQSLAFVIIADVAMRVWKMTDRLLWPAHQVHDELIYVVDEKLAEQVARLVEGEMSKPPAWLPDIPLAAESHIGDTYGDV